MQNNRTKFEAVDIESVQKLRQMLENISYLRNEIVNLAENIQFEAKEILELLKEVDTKESKQQKDTIEKINLINEKVRLLQILCQKYHETQMVFANAAKNAGVLLQERFPDKKVTLWNTFKRNMVKNRRKRDGKENV